MERLIISEWLVEQLEKSEINYMLDRMRAIAEREGNPEGVEIRALHNGAAFYSRTMPWPQFNCVKGLGAEDHLTELLQFYEQRDRAAEFQLIPSKMNVATLKMLHQAGYYHADFHTTLYCEPREVNFTQDNKEFLIRELKEEEIELYAEIHCLGTGLSLNGISSVAANNAVLLGRNQWRFYIAFYKGEPAAVAVMHMEEHIASLTFATTLPQYRGLGLQQRLLLHRIHEAYKFGCKLVVAQCAYCSTSHRNMERAGMRIGYTRAAWRKV